MDSLSQSSSLTLRCLPLSIRTLTDLGILVLQVDVAGPAAKPGVRPIRSRFGLRVNPGYTVVAARTETSKASLQTAVSTTTFGAVAGRPGTLGWLPAPARAPSRASCPDQVRRELSPVFPIAFCGDGDMNRRHVRRGLTAVSAIGPLALPPDAILVVATVVLMSLFLRVEVGVRPRGREGQTRDRLHPMATRAASDSGRSSLPTTAVSTTHRALQKAAPRLSDSSPFAIVCQSTSRSMISPRRQAESRWRIRWTPAPRA